MYIDDFLKLSDAQALTQTAISENVIDLTTARSIGSGEPMSCYFVVTTAADVADGDEDYTFEVKYATNAALTTGEQLLGRRIFESGTPTAPTQDADLLAAGFLFSIPLPPVSSGETARYLGVEYTLAGTTPSVTVDCWIAPTSMGDQLANHANGYTVE